MDDLIKLLKMTEAELKDYVYNYLVMKNMNPTKDNGFVYAKGNIPVLLVAHLDTVFGKLPEIVSFTNENKLMVKKGGIGGDDRCGVFAILRILEDIRPWVLFTEQEEIGGIGAKEAIAKLSKPNVKYIIELDRHGNNDCVFYDCGNLDFIKYIESFGFVTASGVFSDISLLGPAWNIAAVNLSCGYYNEHTFSEYIMFNELMNNIERVKKILHNYRKVDYFDYQELELCYDVVKKNNNIFTPEYDLLWEIFDYPIRSKKRILNKME